MSKTNLLLLAAGFVVGCGAATVAPLAIPPAHAQSETRWETLCISEEAKGNAVAAVLTKKGNEAGREGWEPVGFTHDTQAFAATMCFKRARNPD